jgi:hypothetical protein
VINVDGQGVAKGKNKAQGGKRVIYTLHHNCWDAKNRHNLPEELDFDFAAIAHCIPAGLIAIDSSSTKEPSHAAVSQTKSSPKQGPSKDLKKVETSVPSPKTESKTKPEASNGELSKEIVKDLPGVPKPLADLMMANNITVNEIQRATASRGYYPEDTPIENYDSDFVTGVLVAAWPQVFQMIQNIREEDEIIKDCPYK